MFLGIQIHIIELNILEPIKKRSDLIFKKIQDMFASGAFAYLVLFHQLDTIWSQGVTELSIAMYSQHRTGTGRSPQTQS